MLCFVSSVCALQTDTGMNPAAFSPFLLYTKHEHEVLLRGLTTSTTESTSLQQQKEVSEIIVSSNDSKNKHHQSFDGTGQPGECHQHQPVPASSVITPKILLFLK